MLTASPAHLPAAEAKRLLTLYHYEVSQSVREPVFAEIVQLAARIFQLPISLLALVDASEVLYQASEGGPEYWHQACESAICSHVVQQGKMLILGDLTRASDRQLPAAAKTCALNRGLRFYAGMPLHMPNRAVIGALCVLGYQPRPFGGQERQVLEQLAHLVERLIVVRHASLASAWGEEHWQFTQAFVAEALGRLGAELGTLRGRHEAQVPVPPVVLRPVVRHLNELASVLAEPLPEPA